MTGSHEPARRILNERIRGARDAVEMLEALARIIWARTHGLDRTCPEHCIPTPAALANWLPNCPKETWKDAAKLAGGPEGGLLGEPMTTEVTTPRVFSVLEGTLLFGTLPEGFAAIKPDELSGGIERIHRRWLEQPAEKRGRHPIGPLVEAWQQRPRPAKRNSRPDRILPSRLAMSIPDDRRASRSLFTPALHAAERNGRQLVTPGFKREQSGPVLPLALYDLGVGTVAERSGRAAPLALRIWIEGCLSVHLPDRTGDHPVVVSITLRDFLAKLYPRRKPRPVEYWPRLTAAAEALASNSARIPWEDPETKRGGLRSVVLLSDIPRGPDALDDLVSLTVHLPPGAKDGPILPASLPLWGVRSAPSYRALIGLAFRWHQPGKTRYPMPKGRGRGDGKLWVQSSNPRHYEPLTDREMVSLCFPTSARRWRLVSEARKVLEMLAKNGEIRLTDNGRALPPLPDKQ